MKTRILILLALIMACPWIAEAQEIHTKAVYGQVTTLNNLPVSGIEIKSAKAKTSAITDSLGYFMIVCNERDRLKFKSHVFNTKTAHINKKTPDSLRVNLNFVNSDKNVDVAIGYGYIQEKYRTQAIQYVKGQIDYCSYSSIYDVIRNHFPNLQVLRDGCVIIRGPSSMYASNCALYIVDGIKTDDIDYITPCQVKEISVLKDASSAAIYGCESANGVILINLKRAEDNTSI
ncbi:MAG: TonB-dependent receptor plug domain-containing protein [Bacteroidales bacterium]|nr:TonB-dependent receptor plug domain-containing protein [Bacteroidales bacterium]